MADWATEVNLRAQRARFAGKLVESQLLAETNLPNVANKRSGERPNHLRCVYKPELS